jgi:2',3'-cyclic-nucleotide 2'-phosphodiesterase (5'-nucleotidase family)
MFQTKRVKPILIFCFVLLIAATLASCSTQREVRILHINDFHGFADGYKPYGSDEIQGGLAELAARADELRAEKPTLFLAAGDMVQGNNWANLFQGKSSIEAMNAMNFDAMVVGNHEFDFGQAILKERIGEANFPVLGANVIGLSTLKPYVMKDLDGLTITVIGVVTGDTPVTTHPKNVTGLQFLPPEDTVSKYVRELRGKSDIVIVLSHLGFSADSDLAKKVDGIDVIVGGHSHTKVEKPALVGKTFIVQAFEHGKVLGVLDLTVENGRIIQASGRLESIKPIGKKNKAVAAIVTRYQRQVDAVMNETVGEALADLDGANVRLQETNLGNLVTDVMRNVSGADAAIINGGTIRTSIKQGSIRVSNVYAVVPFDNYIVAIKLTGRQIRDTLEHGVSAIEEEEGRFPQVSGLIFTYDRKGPKGKRVKEVFIAGKPLVADKEYTVATNDFLAAGGDGYKAFGDSVKSSKDYAVIGGAMKGEKLVYSDSGRWLRDVIIDYIKDQKTISPKLEGRIKEVRQ